MVAFFLVLLTLPLTVMFLQKNQDIRQRAEGTPSVTSVDVAPSSVDPNATEQIKVSVIVQGNGETFSVYLYGGPNPPDPAVSPTIRTYDRNTVEQGIYYSIGNTINGTISFSPPVQSGNYFILVNSTIGAAVCDWAGRANTREPSGQVTPTGTCTNVGPQSLVVTESGTSFFCSLQPLEVVSPTKIRAKVIFDGNADYNTLHWKLSNTEGTTPIDEIYTSKPTTPPATFDFTVEAAKGYAVVVQFDSTKAIPSVNCGTQFISTPPAGTTITQTPGGTTITPPAGTTISPAPGSTILDLQLQLHGVGSLDGGNTSPKTPTRTVQVQVYNTNDILMTEKSGQVTYDASKGMFLGPVNLGTTFTSGSYVVKVKTPRYLRKKYPGTAVKIVAGQTNPLPALALTAGDANDDNSLDILDWNYVYGCFSELLPARACPAGWKEASDFNDDGNVNGIDLNLFVREAAVSRTGD